MDAKRFLVRAIGIVLIWVAAFSLAQLIHPIADVAFSLGLIKPHFDGYGRAVEISEGCGVIINPNDGFGTRTIINRGRNAEGAFVLSVSDQSGASRLDQIWEGADYWQWQTRFVVKGDRVYYLEHLPKDGRYESNIHTCG